jgi:hypothetical protein
MTEKEAVRRAHHSPRIMTLGAVEAITAGTTGGERDGVLARHRDEYSRVVAGAEVKVPAASTERPGAARR